MLVAEVRLVLEASYGFAQGLMTSLVAQFGSA